MLGSLKQFIQIDLPPIKPLPQSDSQNEEESLAESKIIEAKANGHKKFSESARMPKAQRQVPNKNNSVAEYQPADKSQLLSKFNKKLQERGANHSRKQISKSMYQSENPRKPLYEHTSFFAKRQITKDYIAKEQLKRKHNLLRAIVRTNQHESENEGVSDYDQSFKRMYEKFQSIYAKPIIEYKNLVIDQNDYPIPTHNSIQIKNRAAKSLNNRKRIEYENCLSWAKKHKKKAGFYADQLGKPETHPKKHDDQYHGNKNTLQGHLMMSEVEKRIKSFSSS